MKGKKKKKIKRSEITDNPQDVTSPKRRLKNARGLIAGIALLLSEKLSDEQRRAIGWTVVAVGALTTIPLALQLLGEIHDRDVTRSCARMSN